MFMAVSCVTAQWYMPSLLFSFSSFRRSVSDSFRAYLPGHSRTDLVQTALKCLLQRYQNATTVTERTA